MYQDQILNNRVSIEELIMPKVSDIIAINIVLEVNNNQSLFILLATDGSINRLGNGGVNNQDKDLFMGITLEPLFEQLMSHLTDEMLEFMGGYDIPEKKGFPCSLSIGLMFTNGEENGFEFSYGSESHGPPQEISEFVIAALDITEPWYQAQKKMVENSSAN
jgi:hypothetical protein